MKRSEILMASALTFGAVVGAGCSSNEQAKAPVTSLKSAEARAQFYTDMGRKELGGRLKTGKARALLGVCVGWSLEQDSKYGIVISPDTWTAQTNTEVFSFMVGAHSASKDLKDIAVVDGPVVYSQENGSKSNPDTTKMTSTKTYVFDKDGVEKPDDQTFAKPVDFNLQPNQGPDGGFIPVETVTGRPIMVSEVLEAEPADFPVACEELQARYNPSMK